MPVELESTANVPGKWPLDDYEPENLEANLDYINNELNEMLVYPNELMVWNVRDREPCTGLELEPVQMHLLVDRTMSVLCCEFPFCRLLACGTPAKRPCSCRLARPRPRLQSRPCRPRCVTRCVIVFALGSLT